MRLEIVNGIKDCIIINDTYNASPDSMKAAIDVLHEIKAQKRQSYCCSGRYARDGRLGLMLIKSWEFMLHKKD